MSKRVRVMGVLAAGLVAGGIWFYGGSLPGHGGLSASEVFAIKRTVRQQTGEPILTIRGNGVGAARVTTGRRGNGLNGGGFEFNLLRTARGWEIIGRSAWVSIGPKAHTANPAMTSLFTGERQWPGMPEQAC